jgi:hypothetical protein
MKYRIITDGTKFRIQTRFLFVFWVTLSSYHGPVGFEASVPYEYDSRQEAEEIIRKIEEKHQAEKKRRWYPIGGSDGDKRRSVPPPNL